MNSRRQVLLIKLLLKLKLAAMGLIMWVAYVTFKNDPTNSQDPISNDGSRKIWAALALVSMILAVCGLFSENKKVRFAGLGAGAIYLLGLGTTYALVHPLSLGIWLVIILGVAFLAGAGIVYFLPENLQSLIDLNESLEDLELEVAGLREKLQNGARK